MAYYPVFLNLSGQRCLVVGGGAVAQRKVEGLLRAGAEVRVIAPELSQALRRLAEERRIEHAARAYQPGDLSGAFLVIAATDDEDVNRSVAAEAREVGTLVNVVDEPELCSFIAPAVLQRGELQVAVSTAGAAPALGARLRDRLSEAIGPEYELVVVLLRSARALLRSERRPNRERRRILRALAASDLPERLRSGDHEGIDRLLAQTLGPGVTLARLRAPLGG